MLQCVSVFMFCSFADIIATSTLSESVKIISESADARPSTSATLPPEDIPTGSRYVNDDRSGLVLIY